MRIYILPFLLQQIAGAFWYLLAVERRDACWEDACLENEDCNPSFLYCAREGSKAMTNWKKISRTVLEAKCVADADVSPFNYGIYAQALTSGIVESEDFISKFFYCLWWGLQNLRYNYSVMACCVTESFFLPPSLHPNSAI